MTTVIEYNLQRCESVIEAHYESFIQVGLALLEIKEQKFFRAAGYRSFELYCHERWGMSKAYANRNIAAAKIAEELEEVAPIGAVSESALRPLAQVAPAQRAEVWEKAVEANGGKAPTAKQVAQAIQPDAVETPADVEAQRISVIEARCAQIMGELTKNPELALAVRKALMVWYALNT